MTTVPDDQGEYGPAMAALSPLMRGFVLALIENPTAPRHEAARAAGYSPVSNLSLRVTAHRLMHDDRVIAAISEETGRKLRSSTLIASSFLERMMLDEGVSMKERAKVAVAILDRTGFGAAQTINVNKTVTDRSGKAVMARLQELANKHGLDATKLLGPAVVDAEFSEVEAGE